MSDKGLAHSGVKNASIPGGDVATSADSWQAYLRSGTAPGSSEGGTGGYEVSAEAERAIDRRLSAASPFRQIATVRTVGAGAFRRPVSQQMDPATLALLEFPAADLYASPAATQPLLDDALIDLDEWLAAEVEDAFSAQETNAFVTGDGVNKPKGFLAYDIVPDAEQQWGQIGAVDGSVCTDALINLVYAPRAQYRPNGRFVMNRRTVSSIRKLKDADGNYIWQPAQRAGETASLLGYPLTEIETMPDVGPDSPAIAFGDFNRGYLIVDRSGVRVLRDPYSAKPYVLFYTTKRVGGGVQNFDAIKVLREPKATTAAASSSVGTTEGRAPILSPEPNEQTPVTQKGGLWMSVDMDAVVGRLSALATRNGPGFNVDVAKADLSALLSLVSDMDALPAAALPSVPTEGQDAGVVAPWKSTPVGQFAPWMTPSQRPSYEDTPFRHWVMVEGFCEHHGSIWARSQIGEAVIRRDTDDDAYQGYRRSDIEEIERRGDMDRGTGIVTFWMPWGNFPPVPSADTPTARPEEAK